MLASFGTFLSSLHGIKLFINLMMAAAAVCELLTEPSCMSLETLFRGKTRILKNCFIILILRHVNSCPLDKKHFCVWGLSKKLRVAAAQGATL